MCQSFSSLGAAASLHFATMDSGPVFEFIFRPATVVFQPKTNSVKQCLIVTTTRKGSTATANCRRAAAPAPDPSHEANKDASELQEAAA
jgi:hypothetical protein